VTSYDLVAVICHHGTAGGTVCASIYTSNVCMLFLGPITLTVTSYAKLVQYFRVGIKDTVLCL